jgi:hypothetical protein
MTITHAPECQARLDARKAEIAAWIAAWPNHCKRCGGWGGFASTYDPSPSGVTLGHGVMHDFDTCPDCIDKGLCPRCGKELTIGPNVRAHPGLESITTLCPACRWQDNETLGCPEPPECFCWIADDPPPPEDF